MLAAGVPAAAADKSGYSLANPVPPALLRELSTDRPDQTESPYTVDAGHFQVEMDFFNYTADRDTAGGADLRARAWSVAPLNLKLGLTNRLDVQLMVSATNSTVILELPNGKSVVLRSAYFASEGEGSTGEGEIKVRWESPYPAEVLR